MAGVNYTQGFSPVDVSGIRMQQAHDPLSNASAFEGVFNKVSYGLGLMAPAAQSGLQAGGLLGNKGGAITSSVIMGFAGGGGGVSTPGMSPMSGGMGGPKFNSWGAASGTSAKYLGGGIPLGDAPGYGASGGVGGIGSAPGYGGGGLPGMGAGGAQDVSQFDNQINSMFQNNMVFLAMQQKVQNVSQITQATSNIVKTDSDAKLNAIRNMRA